jgi:hypothetical protein
MTKAKRFFIIVFTTCLLAISPSVVLADGGGNPSPPAGEYKYVPPPYVGNVSVEFSETCLGSLNGCALLFGTLKRVGRDPADLIQFSGTLYESGVTLIAFQSHTAHDIQGRQIDGPALTPPRAGIFEIIAAHSLYYSEDKNSFTVDLIVVEIMSK